jgi:purine nucleosidase
MNNTFFSASIMLLLLVSTACTPSFKPAIHTSATAPAVWLDADTGNEMDDLYAIARLLIAPQVHLIGLSSAHFNNPDLLVFERWNAYDTKTLNTVAESQRLNEQILTAMNRIDLPHPLGADRQIGRAWGQTDPRDAPAVRAIIAAARQIPDGQHLHILTLGALSNVASALLIAPDILPKIHIFALGAKYNAKKKIWDKSEFNIRNDLNAFDYLLNLKNLELTIMPLEAAFPLQFQRDDTYAALDTTIAIEKILADRWREQNPQDLTRVMWDLALVEAYLNPDLATIKRVKTPPENLKREVRVYSYIDATALTNDFWRALKEH